MAYLQLGDAQYVLDHLKIYYSDKYNKNHEEVRKRDIAPIKSKIPLPPIMGGKVRTTPIDNKDHKMPHIAVDDNYDAIREQEKEYCDKMRYHFNLAAKAHKRGDGKTAKRESQEGKRYKNLYLQEKYSAVARTLASKNKNLNMAESIDLHGLHENEVEYVLEKYVTDIRQKLSVGEIEPNCGAKRGHCCTVITGKGNNSRNFRSVVKDEVRLYLKNHGIGYKECDGYFTISII